MFDTGLKQGAQYYTKWEITDDLSLRYYYLFQDRKGYEGKYYLKSHKKKDYVEIDSLKIVEELIKSSKSTIDILGKQVQNQYIKYKGIFGDQVLISEKKYSTPKDK